MDLEKIISSRVKLVIAVSGGVDSVVLLDMVAKKHPKENIKVAHVDHGLRKESRKDAQFVENLAKEYGVKYASTRLSLKRADEGSARGARYSYLRKTKEEFGAKYIVTAHHLDDQLETILLNLARGTGPLKLWGMKELSGDIYRPLLNVKKEEIEKYAKKHSLKYVLDETNEDNSYKRNLIRHEVVPELLKVNSKVLENVSVGVDLAGELSDFVGSEVGKIMGDTLKVNDMKKAHPFLAKEAIKRKLHEMLGAEKDIYSKNIEEVYGLLSKAGNKKTEIAGFVVRKSYNELVFDANTKKEALGVKSLKPGEGLVFGNHRLSCRFGKGSPAKNNILIARDFEYNLKVRSWEKGDKIKTVSGTKKISDVFTDAKIPQDERKKWPIVFSGEEVVWVPGLAASIYAKSSSNKSCLIVEVK